MPLERFRTAFKLENWFRDWKALLSKHEQGAADVWNPSVRRSVIEALSDSGAEQFLNPLVASHLRHFGRDLARRQTTDRWFWARSEWEKVDISYGLAEPFDEDWEGNWAKGTTGDLGQIEIKVCYAHLNKGKIKELAAQLENRRERDRTPKRLAPNWRLQRYHGLVWLFEQSGFNELRNLGKEVCDQAAGLGLTEVCGFDYPKQADDLGPLWPSTMGKPYSCGMTFALFELN